MKFFNSILAITLSGVILAACTGPQPKEKQMLQLDSDTSAAGDTALLSDIEVSLTDTTTGEESTVQNTTGETTMNTDGAEKTLADFETINALEVTLTTTKGAITFEIYTDKVPLTAQNFLNLAQSGFYDGIVFHRVIADFMAQAGDPLSKDPSKQAMWGTGGPGYVIADEFSTDLTHATAGTVSMANKGTPTTGGSQFFITFAPTQWLDGKHTVFGKVTEGLDVLMTIEQGDVINSVTFK